MKKFESTRLGFFRGMMVLGIGFYAIDCILVSHVPADTPWLERGIYAGSPFGFPLTAIVLALGFLRFIFWKNDEGK